MANKLIQDLGAGAFALTDLLEHQPIAGPPSLKGDVAALVTLLNTIYAPITGGAYVLKAGDTMTGKLTIAQATANTSALVSTGYSLTGANAQSLMDLAGTWNTTGAPIALKLNITNTASNIQSALMDIQLGGLSKFKIDKTGNVESTMGAVFSSSTPWAGTDPGAGQIFAGDGSSNITAFMITSGGGQFGVSSTGQYGFGSGGDAFTSGFDVRLFRDAAATLALRDSTTAQTLRWYRTFTDASNYERGSLRTAAGQIIVAAETAGTGTDDIDLVLTPAGVGRVTLPGGAQLLKTTAAMTSGAAAALGTLTNAPSAGNAAVWCPIMFNGVQHWFPCWT